MNMPAKPAHLQGRDRRGLAEIARVGLGRAVPYVSIEGTAFTLIDENGQQRPITTPYLDCVIIDLTNVVSRVFWGVENGYGSHVKAYPGKGQAYSPPICFSDNGIGASTQAQEPQAQNCKGCQWNAWDSAVSRMTGKGVPACGSTKKVAVYVPGVVFPFLLRIPVMSHENFKHYLSLFAGQDFDIDEVWTRVSFVHGVQGVLQFEPTSKYDPNMLWVDDDSDGIIGEILEHKMTDQLVGRGDIPWTGPVAQVTGRAEGPALAPPPAAPTAAPAFGQGSPQGGFAGTPALQAQQGNAAQAGTAAAPVAQPPKRGRGRPKNPAPEQPQNPAQVGVSPAAPSGFTAPPAAPPPATSAPFGVQAGTPPSEGLRGAISSAFGLPTGRG